MNDQTSVKVSDMNDQELIQFCEDYIAKHNDKTKEGVLATCKAVAEVKNTIESRFGTSYGKKSSHSGKVFRSLQVADFTPQTLNRMASIGTDKRIYENAEFVPASWGTLYELTRLDDITFNDGITDGTINPLMTRKQAQVLRYGSDFEILKPQNPVPEEKTKDMKRIAIIYSLPEHAESVLEKLLQDVRIKDSVVIHDTFTKAKAFDDEMNKTVEAVSNSLNEYFGALDPDERTISSEIKQHVKNERDRKLKMNPVSRKFFHNYSDNKNRLSEASAKKFLMRSDAFETLNAMTIEWKGKPLTVTSLNELRNGINAKMKN